MILGASVSRPLAAVILLGALLGAAGLLAAITLSDLSAASAERSAKDAFMSTAASTGANRRVVVAARPEALFVDAGSETLAAAQIDGLVRAAVDAAGGTVASSRADVTKGEGLPGRIEEQAEISASNEALQAILFRLETGTPVMIVETLTVQPELSSGDSRNSALRASIKLSAYWKVKSP